MAQPSRRIRLLRVAMIVLPFVVVNALITGSLIALVVTARGDLVLVTLSGIATAILAIGPLVVGSLYAYWQPGTSSDGRSTFRRARTLAWVASSGAALTLILLAVFGGLNAAVVVIVVVVSAGLMAAGGPYGSALRRQEEAMGRNSSAVDESAAAYDSRTLRLCVIVFSAALLVCAAGTVLLPLALDPGSRSAQGDLALPAATLVLFSTIVPLLVRGLPIGRSLRDALGGDAGRARRVGRAVAGRRAQELSDGDRAAARIWAPRFLRYQGYMFGWTGLLYAGLILLQISGVTNSSDRRWISAGVLLLLGAAVLVLLPIAIRQRRRVRAWAAQNPIILPAERPEPSA